MQMSLYRATALLLLAAAPAVAQDTRAEARQARIAAEQLALQAAALATQLSASTLARQEMHAQVAAVMQQAQRAAVEAQVAASALPAAAIYQRALVEAFTRDYSQRNDDDASFDRTLDRLHGDGPRAPWARQDPADSIYRAAREQLNRNRYREAARMFSRIRRESQFARSDYRAAAHYWEAFALSRLGGADDLRSARDVLATMRSQHADYDRIADAEALAATINGRLARMGDQRAAQNLQSAARQQTQCGEEDDIRSAALNALLQMQSATALPILKEILASRDACSAPLRGRAMMMLAQHHNAEATEILIDAALNDPDAEVREQATFWLSQVRDESAVDALGRILAGAASTSVQQKAVFALGQHHSERAAEILREYALRNDIPDELRRHVMFALGQSRHAANADFLRDMYRRTNDSELKQMIIMSLARSHQSGRDDSEWLLDIALDENEDMKVRTQALFMAGQAGRVPTARLVRLYDGATDEAMRKQVLFVLSQRAAHDADAVDKLIDIARNAPDLETRKQAIFWLGQSRDPRVAELLLEIIKR